MSITDVYYIELTSVKAFTISLHDELRQLFSTLLTKLVHCSINENGGTSCTNAFIFDRSCNSTDAATLLMLLLLLLMLVLFI